MSHNFMYSEYKGLKNVTVNGCVWTHWNHYRINVTDTTVGKKLEENSYLSSENNQVSRMHKILQIWNPGFRNSSRLL